MNIRKEIGREFAFINIKRVLELRREIESRFVERTAFAATASGQTLKRGIRRARRLRIDEIKDGFGLLVVELPVEKGALCKFTAMRQTSPSGKARLQDAPRRNRTPVALEFNDIFAGVAVGGFEEKDDPLIDICNPTDPDP